MHGGGVTRRGTDDGEITRERGAPGGVGETRQAVSRSLRVLVVDGDRAAGESCAKVLENDGHSVAMCRRGDEVRDALERRSFDVVLLDLQLSGARGMDLLHTFRARSPQTFVIAMSAESSVGTAIAACESGAWEYLAKPFSALQLQILVGRAAHGLRVSWANESLAPEQVSTGKGDLALLGASPSIRSVIDLARRVAATDASVFITGESGTGKESVAQFIHHESQRRSRPLVAINCAAIPETLLETEMFGHRKGAFTGAVEDKQGLLEVANGGTLFLDELIQMPLSTQAKLLRVIQDGVVRRLGSDSVNAVVNVRFIAATNQCPESAIHNGRLREDLYYRLRVFPIHLPPLRERREDIPLLADHFLRIFWTRHRRGSAPPRLSDEARQALVDHSWRGNIRELQNVMERGVVLFEPAMVILPEDIPFAVHAEEPYGSTRSGDRFPLYGSLDADGYFETRDRVLAQFERRYLGELIARTGGNLSKAARLAGIQRTTLYRLMEKHGLHRQITLLASEHAHKSVNDVGLL